MALKLEVRRVTLAGTLWSMTLLGAAAGFLAQVAMARHLGPTGLAPFATVISVVNVLVPVAFLGAGSELVRAFGARGRVPGPFLRSLVIAVWAIALSIGLAGAAWIVFANPGGHAREIALLTVPLILGGTSAALLDAVLIIQGPRWMLMAWQALPNVLRLAAIGAAVTLGTGMTGIAVALACAGLVLLVSSIVPLLRRTTSDGPNESWSFIGFLSASWPFALSNVLYGAFVQGGILWMTAVGQTFEVGILSVAMTVYLVVHLLSHALTRRILHVQFTRLLRSPEQLHAAFRAAEARMLLVGLVMGIVGIALAPLILPLLFGPGLSAAVLPLQVLMLASPFRFASAVSTALLNAGLGPRRNTLVEAIATLFQLACAGPMAFLLGPVGAAMALVASEVVLGLGLYLVVQRSNGKPPSDLDGPTTIMPAPEVGQA